MEKIKSLKLTILLGLMAGILVLILLPNQLLAQCDQTTDGDSDGFLYNQEISGCSGSIIVNKTHPTMDPDVKDLFVFLLETFTPPSGNPPIPPYNGSWIPTDPLLLISRPKTSGGLEIITHDIVDPTWVSKAPYITARQKGIMLLESHDTNPATTGGSDEVVGDALVGTPNSVNPAHIYTQKIYNLIQKACAGGYWPSKCCDDKGYCGQDLVDRYVRHTIAHESGHMMKSRYLTTNKNDTKILQTIGNHYPDGSGYVLDYKVTYSLDSHSGKIIFKLGEIFTTVDQANVKLK